MPEVILNVTEAHEFGLTPRIFILLNGETGYIDLGDIESLKDASAYDVKSHKLAADGYRRVNDEQLVSAHRKYEAVATSFAAENSIMRYLGSKGADVIQASVTAPTGTASFTNVKKGRSYFLGALDVNTVVVTVAAATKVVDVDYTLDAGAGRIHILPSGSIADAANVGVTFGNAARTTNVVSAFTKADFRGTVRIELKNVHDPVPLYTETFAGVIIVTGFPERNEDCAKMTYHITATGKPTITKRHAAIA